MKYYLIGNVNKEHYIEYIITRKLYYCDTDSIEIIKCMDYEDMSLDYLLNEYIRYKEYLYNKFYISCNLKNKYEIKKLDIINKLPIFNKFDHKEIIKTIDTDKQFKTGDVITIKGNEYSVTYKYNSDLNRDELYVDFVINTIVDEELKKSCEEKLIKLNEKIKEYNNELDKEYNCELQEQENKKLGIIGKVKKLLGIGK